jgi:dTDP-4-amino-4,6-dideoxygalactose transaminase
MTIQFLNLHSQYLSIKEEVDAAFRLIIEQSAYIGGDAVEKFEIAFANFQNATNCIGVANGTDALEIAIEALSLPPASEIIVPANSFIASAEAVTRSGHRVVFADIDPNSYTLSIPDVRRRITAKTKAIVAVHLYGHPCDMDGLLDLSVSYGLKIIEDCAQAHGAEYRNKRVGALGHIGAFSFYPGKNLGAYGDAGAILTNDNELAKRCRMIANHGRIDKYNHLIEGRNSRLDGIQAAVLSVKLKYLDGWIKKRNLVARIYQDALANVPHIVLPQIAGNVRHAFHLFVIRSPFRDALQQKLNQCGVETGIHYPIALPKLKAYAYLQQYLEPMLSNNYDQQLLSLPIGEHLTEAEVGEIIQLIQSFKHSF